MSKIQQSQRLRRLLAVESARIMAEEGVVDFRVAKEKAARRLGTGGDAQHHWPNNSEVEAELQARLTLFHGPDHATDLRQLREQALQAMLWLEDFQPRLTGPVLSGTATRHGVITLHLFVDTPESVIFFLMDQKTPYEESWQRLHFGDAPAEDYPCLKVEHGGAEIRLVIFGLDEDRRSPASPVDGKPLKRFGVPQLRKLLEKTQCSAV
ncbi:nucleotidyltransferase [Acidithiobacillus marinus]|uniref:Nucleotidyltransferase n=1 Tax=Acidithiobacillus marinus TaxID=187490 RepID=A0A2I1DK70_9PROT|nr:nucleotidyltransferase [Acidithiobacillus marinus]PKY10287.1 nucleotidyltransferase [Acidithiobacillus marinus]